MYKRPAPIKKTPAMGSSYGKSSSKGFIPKERVVKYEEESWIVKDKDFPYIVEDISEDTSEPGVDGEEFKIRGYVSKDFSLEKFKEEIHSFFTRKGFKGELIKSEDNMYYTPEETDLYIGYQCEMKDKDEKSNAYTKITLGRSHLLNYLEWMEDRDIRTPYLNNEQIENDGWQPVGGTPHQRTFRMKSAVPDKLETGKTFEITKYLAAQTPWIEVTTIQDKKQVTLYKGRCKSINELRLICRMLCII